MDKKIILVVDDTPANIDVLRGILKDKYKVKVATNGAKAIQIMQKLPCPELVLLDVMMPEMDGYEVCRQLKADPQTETVPIIFVSGNALQADQQKGLEMGAKAYLSKPVDPLELNKLIEQFL